MYDYDICLGLKLSINLHHHMLYMHVQYMLAVYSDMNLTYLKPSYFSDIINLANLVSMNLTHIYFSEFTAGKATNWQII